MTNVDANTDISKKQLKRGQKIYQKACKEFDYKKLSHKEFDKKELKAIIIKNNYCKKLNTKNMNALITYLKFKSSNSIIEEKESFEIEVPHNHKCPVCGMYVYKYPHWVAKLEFKNSEPSYFDGVKDMMKYIFSPKEYIGNRSFDEVQNDIKNIFVSDYYSLKKIDAKKAYYVIGSTVYGPMGNELIPFELLEDAKVFAQDYSGKKILKYSEISKENLPD
jgi:nitrous oxide reductase accessory protein NosL